MNTDKKSLTIDSNVPETENNEQKKEIENKEQNK
jgi:hypothetical protein